MKVFYHSVDLDGQSSAAILYQKFPNAEYIPINYGDYYDLNLIQKNEEVYIVDFTFIPFEIMTQLKEKCGKNLFWIDHHDSAIKNSKKYKLDDLNGIRDHNFAACELVWKFIHGTITPYPIFLLGKYDIWKHDLDDDILPFQYGMRIQNTNPNSKLWKKLLQHDNHFIIDDIITDGEAILKYTKQSNQKVCDELVFETDFEGLKCIAINHPPTNSKIFDNKWDAQKYDAMIIFNFNGKKWKVSLYSNGNDSNNLGEIAAKYGGGGHVSAAGFNVDDITSIIPNLKKL